MFMYGEDVDQGYNKKKMIKTRKEEEQKEERKGGREIQHNGVVMNINPKHACGIL